MYALAGVELCAANTKYHSTFVDAEYGNDVFQAPGSFDVFATQDALIARPNG
jgi:hypothetical protein